MKIFLKYGCLLLIMLAMQLTASSCDKAKLESYLYPYPYREYFGWTLTYQVNGKKTEISHVYDPGPGLHFQLPPDYIEFDLMYNLIMFSGVQHNGDKSYSVDYSRLALNVMESGLYFHILGPGDGKFKDNHIYSSPEDIVLYHPALLSDFANPLLNANGLNNWNTIPSFRGFDVKVLSSCFLFNHTIKLGTGKILNIHFNFEEVITAVPEGWNGSPTVGDTLRITNGHLAHWAGELDSLVFE